MTTVQHLAATRIDHDGYQILLVKAGNRGVRRVVPPAGEAHAFDTIEWSRDVEVAVSPKGRSVRVWVDGVEVRP